MKKDWEIGDEVIVTKTLSKAKDYPYKVGYTFIAESFDNGEQNYGVCAPGDAEWYTETHCVRKATKLDKVLK